MKVEQSILSQYKASLSMMVKVITLCPEIHWNDEKHDNRFWHIAYHALWYTDFYLSPDEESYQPTKHYVPEYQFLGDFPWPSDRKPTIGEPCTKEHILDFARVITERLRTKLDRLDLDGPSGFPWLPFDKFELQIYNIRHIQHHVAQLIQILRSDAGISIDWIGMG